MPDRYPTYNSLLVSFVQRCSQTQKIFSSRSSSLYPSSPRHHTTTRLSLWELLQAGFSRAPAALGWSLNEQAMRSVVITRMRASISLDRVSQEGGAAKIRILLPLLCFLQSLSIGVGRTTAAPAVEAVATTCFVSTAVSCSRVVQSSTR